jgi:pimeloyl-ACP methyl ester carboxylesterase
LLIGLSAVVLTLVFYNRKRARNVFTALAALELANAALRFKTPADVEDLSEMPAPELVHSGLVNGILMRWEEHGKAKAMPVVFLHGLPTHPRLWRYVIPRLANTSVRCLAWEMVGYGWSMKEGLGKDISVARQAEYLHSWLGHMRIEKAIFVGHDLGGGVLQRLAISHPELVAGMVLADSVAYDNWPVSAVKIARKMEWLIQRLPPALIKPFFLSALFNLGHDNDFRRSESAELHWHPYARSIGPKAFVHQLMSLNTDDTNAIAEKLRELKIPARIVWALSDPLSIQSGERLARDLDAPLLKIKAGKHFTPEDHPEILVQAIKGVLIEVKELVRSS